MAQNNAGPLRLIVSFLSGASAKDHKATFAELHKRNGVADALYVAGSEHEQDPRVKPYEDLRLKGEALGLVWVEPAALPSAIQKLQEAGAGFIYLLSHNNDLDTSPALQPLPHLGDEPAPNLAGHLDRCYRATEAAWTYLIETYRLGHTISPASHWLIDNSYLVRTQIRELKKDLARELRRPDEKALEVARLARRMVEQVNHSVKQSSIIEFLDSCQREHALTIAQLWYFPFFVRVVLLEELAQLSARLVYGQVDRELAAMWASRLAAGANQEPDNLDRLFEAFSRQPYRTNKKFLISLMEQLQDREGVLATVQRWIEERQGIIAGELVRTSHVEEAQESLLAANTFGTLRNFDHLDFKEIFEAVSRTEAILRQDPGGVYAASNFNTRNRCRSVIQGLSRKGGKDEPSVARVAIELSRTEGYKSPSDVTHFLLGPGVVELENHLNVTPGVGIRATRLLRHYSTAVYLTSIGLLTASFVGVTLHLAWDAGIHQPRLLALLGLLALFPLSELAIQIVHTMLIALLPPIPLPRMDFKNGIPDEAVTLVVVPMMLSSRTTIKSELEKLEVRFLANRDNNLFFSLFADYTDADREITPTDHELIVAAQDGIRALNERYGEMRFLLFHRPRVWSYSEEKWIARERKRGKIEDLNAFLSQDVGKEILIEGVLLKPIAFVITLDSDTQLPPTSARRMIETAAHPLNGVRIDPDSGIRTRGYSIIQPRVSIALPGATATRFTRIFADAHGTDPYCSLVSDAHQDLFEEAMFHGKAIYNVRAFNDIVGNRFPPETLLSHDLIEGAHAGVALASDIELLENLPLNYPSYSRRAHRWIRGDWQIARWAFGWVPGPNGTVRRNPLSILNRWRILDNLRRSVVPIASILLLFFGWLFSTVPGVWSIVIALAVAIPAFAPLLNRWTHQLEGTVYGWQGAADDLARTIVMIAFLPHQAWIAADAIARALNRSVVTKKKLLEWETADVAEASQRFHMETTRRQIWIISAASLVLFIALAFRNELLPTAAFLFMWISSPWLMGWLGREGGVFVHQGLKEDDQSYLHQVSRRTWRYFDDLVDASTNWLPPDNTQLALRIEVAHRTSPTNIGMWLASAVAAWDFGYLTADDLCIRCTRTLDTIGRLEKFEGHLLNWYDTTSLDPLLPRYVSTVDSGNLIACLWVLQRACEEVIDAPLLHSSTVRGLTDTLSVLSKVGGDDPSLGVALCGLSATLSTAPSNSDLPAQVRLAALQASSLRETLKWQIGKDEAEITYWTSHLAGELDAWASLTERYLRWMETLRRPPDEFVRLAGEDAPRLRKAILRQMPSLHGLAKNSHIASGSPLAELLQRRSDASLPQPVSAWLERLNVEYEEAASNAGSAVIALRALASKADSTAAAMRMDFLYDWSRRLFGVGYVVGEPRIFYSHYDLLASECRLASLVAIAKNDVPMDHWFALGRSRISTPRQQATLSWSGTMFEYLMPIIFTYAFENSFLEASCREAVAGQISFSERVGLPWGVSESAYSAIDANQTYQYRAFGIPSLALNPNADPGPVVAPYATALALQVDPAAATTNLRRLEGLGMAGPMGFYESIDFTRQAKKDGTPGVIVYAYMAHHQGMSLLALDNVLLNNGMQARFHSDLRIRAVNALLYERIPIARTENRSDITSPIVSIVRPAVEEPDRVWTEATSVPQVHLNCNGNYSIMITNSGGGYSRWKGLDLTRWRSDTTLDDWGTYAWVRDVRSGAIWSPSRYPFSPRSASARFSVDRAELRSQFQDVETSLDITVATGDDVELRRLSITNRSARPRTLEITFYTELALAPHAADRAHPAFQKLFIQTEVLNDSSLLAWRRPRDDHQAPVYAGAALLGVAEEVQFETSREAFLGRAKDLRNADGLAKSLAGMTGTVIDPIFCLRAVIRLEARENRVITFAMMAASSRSEVLALLDRYRRTDAIANGFELAWTRAQLELRYFGITPGVVHRFQELASYMLYFHPRMRSSRTRVRDNTLGQSALWSWGISGDLPIIVASVSDVNGLSVLREIILAWQFWKVRGLDSDLVILNREQPSYDLPLRHALTALIETRGGASTNGSGRSFLLDWHTLDETHQNLVLAVARVVIGCHLGPLQRQLLNDSEPVFTPHQPPPKLPSQETSEPLPFLELPYFNSIGGFNHDGSEYAIYLDTDVRTPAPWANVIANSKFGTVATESGLGFTWFNNSQQFRLSPWHNDPIRDPQGEIIYIRDDDSGAVWTPTALPIRETEPYRARHGQGYTVFEHSSHAVSQELTVFIALEDPVKLCKLTLRNQSNRPRRLTVTFFVDLILGITREESGPHLVTSYQSDTGAVLARQKWSEAYQEHIVFATSTIAPASFAADRSTFLGREGSLERPSGLNMAALDGRTGAGADACAALQVHLFLPPMDQREVTFILGAEKTLEAASNLLRRYQHEGIVDEALHKVRQSWESILSAVQVKTPVLSVNFLLNRWLPYQTLSCRFWARSATYQSGGAFGFRDQLQDALGLIYMRPDLTRQHLLSAASRQFYNGDVQHWWHATSGLGVRTRCSDDYLWLPFVVARYVSITGDVGVLSEPVRFLEAPELKPDEQESMSTPHVSLEQTPLWDHCRRALDLALSRLSARGLPLIGSCDWNDGFSEVGSAGRGESIWLAWFLITALNEAATIEERTDKARAASWRHSARNIAKAVEKHAWDGGWYVRAFFDDGSPLGSAKNIEARIDSLAQSWAVLSGASDSQRAAIAMESSSHELVREGDGVVLLFTPPFDHSEPHPGYIMGYPPGVRENGGQYTHGSLWLAQAFCRLRNGDEAVRLLQIMNPVERSRSPEGAKTYKGEPYVVAADVSAAEGRTGASGWTWYTGSSAWMYRIWLEDVLGFKLTGNELRIDPAIPADWPGFELRYRLGNTFYEVVVERGDTSCTTVDERVALDSIIRLEDDSNTHKIRVTVLNGESTSSRELDFHELLF